MPVFNIAGYRWDTDSSFGSDSNDLVMGNNADNFVVGNKGNDLLWGGGGNDTFAFTRGDSGGGDSGRDVILDFHSGEDHILFFGGNVSPKEVTATDTPDGMLIEYTGLGPSVGPDGPEEILLFHVHQLDFQHDLVWSR
jgi:Ca2+-binding RTX toxin-like protein